MQALAATPMGRRLAEVFRQVRPIVEQHEALPASASPQAKGEKVIAAARCIRHWHDALNGDGMVVSASHVRELWQALDDYDAALPASLEEPK